MLKRSARNSRPTRSWRRTWFETLKSKSFKGGPHMILRPAFPYPRAGGKVNTRVGWSHAVGFPLDRPQGLMPGFRSGLSAGKFAPFSELLKLPRLAVKGGPDTIETIPPRRQPPPNLPLNPIELLASRFRAPKGNYYKKFPTKTSVRSNEERP